MYYHCTTYNDFTKVKKKGGPGPIRLHCQSIAVSLLVADGHRRVISSQHFASFRYSKSVPLLNYITGWGEALWVLWESSVLPKKAY